MPTPIRTTLAALTSALGLLAAGCHREPPATWTAADPTAHGAELPDGMVAAAGLTVRGFAQDPLLRNPVAIALDGRGRLYVAETHRYRRSVFDITMHPAWLGDDLSLRTVADRRAFLLRTFADDPKALTADSELVRLVVDDDGDGLADRSTVFADGFDDPVSGAAAGIVAADRDVWLACVPDLWRFPGGVDHATAVERARVATGFGVHVGVSGHDLHGLTLGPDGRIYFSNGDRGAHVTLDGGAEIDLPDTGAVFRCERDGSGLEVFATGLRNPQELAFDELGHLFTADNDTAGDDHSRVLFVVPGGDYGWRMSYQHQQGFGPWVQEDVWKGGIDGMLPTSGYVAQGPSGLAHYPGTGFAPEQDGRFYVCDFPQGVLSFRVEPHGAGFATSDVRRVLWKLWPTDVTFGPDGALWVSDWVSGWGLPERGRIYRVFADGALDADPAQRTRRILSEGFDRRPVSELVAMLADADQRVRMGAESALVGRDDTGATPALMDALDAANAPRMQRVHALWTLAWRARRGRGPDRFVIGALSDREPAIREAAARAAGELRVPAARTGLVTCLTDPAPRVRMEAALALARVGDSTSIQPILAMLEAGGADDPFLLHAGVEALRRLAPAAALGDLHDHASAGVRRAALLALRRQAAPEIASYLADPEPRLQIEAARAIHDVPIEGAMPALAAWAADPACPAAARSRAIDAAFRLGRPRDAEALGRCAADRSLAAPRRVQALNALANWAAPDPVDAIVGLWRPLPARDPTPAANAVGKIADDVATTADDALVIEALVDAVRRLKVAAAAQALAHLASGPNGAPALRAAALRGLSAIGRRDELASAVEAAFDGDAAEPRAVACSLLPEIDPAGAAARCARLARDDTDLRVRQAAVTALGALTDEASVRALADLLRGLDELPATLHLDVLEAAEHRDAPELRSLLAERAAALDPNDPLARWRCALAGGDPTAGRRIFEARADVQCQRCHMVHGVGGNVGPPLDHVGAQDPAAILESVIVPSARIVDGYPPAMPPVAAQFLTRHEVRDLIAWLSSLR